MDMGEMKPRSEALRSALDKPKGENNDGQVMLSVAEAHKRLGVSRNTLYRLINTRKLVSVKIGSRRLISSCAVTEYIRRLEDEAEPER